MLSRADLRMGVSKSVECMSWGMSFWKAEGRRQKEPA